MQFLIRERDRSLSRYRTGSINRSFHKTKACKKYRIPMESKHTYIICMCYIVFQSSSTIFMSFDSFKCQSKVRA